MLSISGQVHCRAIDGYEDIVAVQVYRMAAGESSFIVDISILHQEVLLHIDLIHSLFQAFVHCGF